MNTDLASLHKILKDPTRRKIILHLSDRGQLTYMELMNLLQITNTGKFNYHLKILGDLIEKVNNGKYHLTERGQVASQLLQKFPRKTIMETMPLSARVTMDRFGFAGAILGMVGGVMSILEASLFFLQYVYSVRMVEYLVAWYLVAMGLGVLVLFGALLAFRGPKITGGAIMLFVSLSYPINWVLLLLPSNVMHIVPLVYVYYVLHYNLFVASWWLLFGMLGGILILLSKTGQKQDKRQAVNCLH